MTRMSDERLDNLAQSWQEHVGSLMEEYGAPTVHSILSRTESEALELLDELKAERQRVEKLEGCRQELIEVTNACRDLRVNLTHTLEECVRDVYAENERLRKRIIDLEDELKFYAGWVTPIEPT